MTVHFKKQCIVVKDVKCQVPCETKWNKTQPYLIMQGMATNVEIIDNVAYMYIKIHRELEKKLSRQPHKLEIPGAVPGLATTLAL